MQADVQHQTNYVHISLQFLAGSVGAMWTSYGESLIGLLCMIALDVLTGWHSGLQTRSLSSDKSRRGTHGKMLLLAPWVVAVILEQTYRLQAVMPTIVGFKVSLPGIVAGFYMAHEGLSVLENVARAGLPVPSALRSALVKAQAAGQAAGEKEER